MFSNIKIGRRLLLLISVLTLTFIVTGAVSLLGISDVSRDSADLNQKTAESAEFAKLAGLVRYHLVDVGHRLSTGGLSWKDAATQLETGAREFDELWAYQAQRILGDSKQEEFYEDSFSLESELVKQGFTELRKIAKSANPDRLGLYLLKDSRGYAEPFLNAADGLTALGSAEAQAIFDNTEAQSQLYLLISVTLVAIGLLLAVTLGPAVYFSITGPIRNISKVVDRVSEGELEARTGLSSKDELGQLANAFDEMLNERVSTMAKAEGENENLNNSIIELLEAVSNLSERDLTVRVPVAEDVTGPVADAMNYMASETARVLAEIRRISGQVAGAATEVESQGQKVNQLAADERVIVENSMVKLDEASKTMSQIAKQAKVSNDIAEKAAVSTQEALEAVSKTANGMNEIRETISETEKRLKRLGERSQEINTVVEIINNIAERTHILALNASMQAAAAGDAGRGFAVVADEVQRLAESSRQSTSEIAGLVGNIQSETAETMATMNKVISQVVEGSELAQSSGVQMQRTQETTSELALAVAQIAKHSLVQAHVSNKLREQTELVHRSTEVTNAELRQQADQTSSLVEFSRQLLESVNVFKLPA